MNLFHFFPLAYRPFIDSLETAIPNLSNYWLVFVLPLLAGISVVYKGTKVGDLGRLPSEAGKMFVQIVVVMVLAAVAVTCIYWALMKWT